MMMAWATRLSSRPPVLRVLLLLLLTPRIQTSEGIGGWFTNDGTAAESLVVGSSGTTASGKPLEERMKPFLAVDGNVTSQWNSKIDPADNSCWLTLDFGSEVTVHGFALIQRGDITHDAKDHELQTGETKDGPWQSAGSFVGKQCKPPAFSAAQCREKNQAGAAAFRTTFDLPTPATSRYFRWVAKSRYSEFQLYLYEIEFRGSNWAAVLLLLLGIGSCVYVSGGVALAAKTEGRPWRLSSHPHHTLWVELHGLVLDGVAYARAVAAGREMAGGRYAAAKQRSGGRAGRSSQQQQPVGYGSTQQGGRQEKAKTKSSKRPKDKGHAVSHEPPGHDDDTNVSESQSPSAAAAGVASAGGGRWVHVPG
jgi:hypothetical protein